MTRLRLAVLISGRGSNMATLIEATRAEDYPAEPVLVLSNRPDAGGLETALEAGVPVVAVDHKIYGKDREKFERAMDAELEASGVEIIALAGFMRVLTPWFVSKWHGRLINIHPSLLPKYKGLDTHQRALDAGDSEAGCSVHWVTSGVDEGEIIAQARVPIEAGDTATSLAQRILPAEHELYPKALAMACRSLMSDSDVKGAKAR